LNFLRLSLLFGPEDRSTTESWSIGLHVDDLPAAHARAQALIKHFYSQGVSVVSDIPLNVLRVRVTGDAAVIDGGELWEDLKSAVAGQARVLI
jgi:hypothetical protein